MKAEVILAPDFSSRPAKLVFKWQNNGYGPWDVTADGHLVMTRVPQSDSTAAAGSARGRLPGRTVLVVNWLDDLRARMKRKGGTP